MELSDAMRSVGTCRRFLDREVPDEVLWRALEVARFGPQGGNRQPVRFVIVRNAEDKRRLGKLYVEQWQRYTGRAVETLPAESLGEVDAFARDFGSHPAIVVVCAHLQSLLATDTGLGRLSIVGGASVYPIVQNLLLALRDQGVASAITTLLCAREPEVKQLLGIPAEYATACHLAVGYPAQPFPRKLRRRPVEEIAFRERFEGPPLGLDGPPWGFDGPPLRGG